jgi:exosortase K
MGLKKEEMSEQPIKTGAARLLENGIFHAAGLVLILAVKQHYSTADAEALRWILTPVARIVTLLTGTNFEWVREAGFVNHSHGVVIAPACAGVNFLIICFGALFFTFVSRWRGNLGKCAWFGISAVAAFLATLIANSLRIILSICLYDAPIYGGRITPDKVHQLAGIVIFVTLLTLIWLATKKLIVRYGPMGAPSAETRSRGMGRTPLSMMFLLVPFAWYGLITIIVPLLNGAAGRYGSGFTEHSLMVMFVCGCGFLITAWATAQGKKKVDRPD